jgi:hypothetical protein
MSIPIGHEGTFAITQRRHPLERGDPGEIFVTFQ